MSQDRQENFSWSKIRRHGNDELPTGKDAVKILRAVQKENAPISTRKPAITKIAKLSYEPNKTVSKSIKSAKRNLSLALKKEGTNNGNPSIYDKEDENPNRIITQKLFLSVNKTDIDQSCSEALQNLNEVKKKEQSENFLEIKDNYSVLDLKVVSAEKSTNILDGDWPSLKTTCSEKSSTRRNENIISGKFPKRSKSTHSIQKVPSAQPTPKANAIASSQSQNPRSFSNLKMRSKSENNINVAKANDNNNAQRQKKRPNQPYIRSKEKIKQSETEKGIIKERLENLKKNTRKILIQNINKTKGKNAKKATKTEMKVPVHNIEVDNANIKIVDKTSQEINFSNQSSKRLGILGEKDSDNMNQISHCLTKKVGLLRMVDSTVDSETQKIELRAPNISLVPGPKCENLSYDGILSLEFPTSKMDNQISLSAKSNIPNTPLPTPVENGKQELPTSIKNVNVVCINSSQSLNEKTGLELLVPNVKLTTDTKNEIKATKIDIEEKKSPMPYWLKPTSVETYPYSFIMAVRKKLEAVANPILMSKTDVSNKFEKSKHINVSSSLGGLKPDNTKKSARRSVNHSERRKIPSEAKCVNANLGHIQKNESNVEDKDELTYFKHVVAHSENLAIKSQKTSRSYIDITSNFSKITLEDPESNTISEVSSIKSESINPILCSTKINHGHDNQGDTTTSSIAFSSPENRKFRNHHNEMHKFQCLEEKRKQSQFSNAHKFSPLSTEKIDNLTIKSRSVPENVNVKRGERCESSSINTDIKSTSTNSPNQAGNVNFDELLISFNKSLSQVMEVNEQLHSSLQRKSKSHKSSESQYVDRYTSDFEGDKSSSLRSSNQEHGGSISKRSSALLSSTQSQNIVLNTVKSSSISTVISDHSTRNEETLNQPIFAEIIDETMSGTLIETAESSQKLNENNSEEFRDSIENTRRMSQSQERPLELEFSKDSLDVFQEPDEYTKSKNTSNRISTRNINFSRGETEENRAPSKISESTSRETFSGGPPGYLKNPENENKMNPHTFNSSLGSDIFAVFNQSDFELSITSRNGSLSETNVTYSSIGFYEKLISTETSKSEYLTALLKKREKALLDRTRGQIAWLEIQKGRFRSKGLLTQISTIKKKQRAILLKMEKEREEIKRILKSKGKSNNCSHQITNRMSQVMEAVSLRRKILGDSEKQSNRILRGFELQRSQKLEMILRKREEDLRKRREYIEKLVEWHKRLDKEEEEVIELEEMLFKQHSELTRKHTKKKEQKLLKINKSLKILQSIASSTDDNEDIRDSVCVTGAEINKLWQRLTGRKEIRFDETGQYNLTKEDLEKLYESAKKVVLKNFNEGEKIRFLLENANLNQSNALHNSEELLVPRLNLNICSNESEKENFIESDFTISTRKSNKSVSERNSSMVSAAGSSIKTNFQNNSHVMRENRLQDELYETNSESEINSVKETDSQKEIGSSANSKFNKDNNSSYSNLTKHASQSRLLETGMSNVRQLISLQKKFDEDRSTHTQQVSSFINSSFIQTNLKSSSNEKCTTDGISEISTDIKTIGSDIKSLNEISESIISKNTLLETVTRFPENLDSTIIIVSEDLDSQKTLKTDEILESQSSTTKNSGTEDLTSTNKSQSIPCETLESKSCIIEALETLNEVSDHTVVSSGSIENKDSVTLDEVKENINSLIRSSNAASEVSEYTNLTEKPEEDMINLTFVKHSPEDNCGSQSSNCIEISANSIIQSRISIIKNTSSHHTYDDDLFENNTLLDDVSLPSFEETFDDMKSIAHIVESVEDSDTRSLTEKKDKLDSPSELEQRLIVIDESLKELSDTFERVLSPEKLSKTLEIQINLKHCADQDEEGISGPPSSDDTYALSPLSSDEKSCELSNTKMPDIVNEVELRRHQSSESENTIRQIENSVPYVFLREIPNKPPPPYVPPAHGSPMTTIFPSEERIRDIIYRRTKELFNEVMQHDVAGPLVLDENITNIYERIILDICNECVTDIQPSKDEFWSYPNYTKPLALFNPPDRLACLQEFVYKRIRKLLGMDKKNNLDRSSLLGMGRRKRDHVDEILIQELYEEERKWITFDLEEKEVRTVIVDEIINDLVSEVIDNLEIKYSERKDFSKKIRNIT